MDSYKHDVGLSDAQVLSELPRFLRGEPSRWFQVLKPHLFNWAQFTEPFQKAFLPFNNQERIWRNILDHVQAPDEPLLTFVAHMLCEFARLRNPPPEKEQVEIICKHALEKYTVALYGTSVLSVADLLLRAHELHAALGHRDHVRPPPPPRGPVTSVFCYGCSLPDFTAHTCPQCNSLDRREKERGVGTVTERAGEKASAQPCGPPGMPHVNRGQAKKGGQPQGNLKGGRLYQRGTPSPQELVEPHTNATGVNLLGHIEDTSSTVFWNTPFCVTLKLKNHVVTATLDTGASLSAIQATYTEKNLSGKIKCTPWTAPPLRLADSAHCNPIGVTWLPVWLQGQRFFHRFVILSQMSSPVMLGMDFMLRASITIHVPSRTVSIGTKADQNRGVQGDAPILEETVCALEGPDLTCSQEDASAISVKVGESSLNHDQKGKLHALLGDFQGLFSGRLGHTSLAEHRIETGDTKPINLPAYRTSPLKKKLIEEQIQIMLEEDIIEPASGPWAAPVVIVPKASGEPRFCVDYRGLNHVTVKYRYPLPRVDESLDFLARGNFISTIDLAQGYWQDSPPREYRFQPSKDALWKGICRPCGPADPTFVSRDRRPLPDPVTDPRKKSIQETHEHARTALQASHKRKKHYYDLKHRPVVYQLGDLVRLKTHPCSDAAANLTAKLACVYAGPYRVVQKLSEVNYRVANMDGTDVGVVHVVNLQPFYTWTTAESQNSRQHSSSCFRQHESHRAVVENPVVTLENLDEEYSTEEECYAPDEAVREEPTPREEMNGPESNIVDLSQSLANMFDGDIDVPITSNYGLRSRVDTTTMLLTDVDYTTGQDPEMGVTVSPTHISDPTDFPVTHAYSLRPRVHPRVTMDWGTNRWTNKYHTQRLDQVGVN
ncbi:hypothetical protein SRHO_G00123800 [Serrasalmus rhombeus]